MPPLLRQSLLDTARDSLMQAVPNALALYAYGSVIRGDDRPDSDIDLGVVLQPGKSIPDHLGLLATLEEKLQRRVDLVDLRRCGNVLRKAVLTEGVVLHTANADELLAWEASALSEYAEHREQIRDILTQFHATGVGYGR